jgi:hypothetical protein
VPSHHSLLISSHPYCSYYYHTLLLLLLLQLTSHIVPNSTTTNLTSFLSLLQTTTSSHCSWHTINPQSHISSITGTIISLSFPCSYLPSQPQLPLSLLLLLQPQLPLTSPSYFYNHNFNISFFIQAVRMHIRMKFPQHGLPSTSSVDLDDSSAVLQV